MFSNTHNVACFLCLGHSLKQGRRNHSVVTLLGSVLCIHAIRVRVHSQVSRPTPHSVRWCSVVSCLPHSVRLSVSTNRILCSLVFVGSKSWITVYHADLRFEPAFPESELPLTHALDRTATGIVFTLLSFILITLPSVQQLIQSVETLTANNKQARSSSTPQKLVYCDQFNTGLSPRAIFCAGKKPRTKSCRRDVTLRRIWIVASFKFSVVHGGRTSQYCSKLRIYIAYRPLCECHRLLLLLIWFDILLIINICCVCVCVYTNTHLNFDFINSVVLT